MPCVIKILGFEIKDIKDFVSKHLISTRENGGYCDLCDKVEEKCNCDCDGCSSGRNQCECEDGYINKNIIDVTLAKLKNFVILSDDTPDELPVDDMIDEIIEDSNIKIECGEEENSYRIKRIYTDGHHIGEFFIVDEQGSDDWIMMDSFENIKNKANQFEKDDEILGFKQELKIYTILKT